MSDELSSLRAQIADLDQRITDCVVKRLALAREAGQVKRALDQPMRNLAVERQVVDRYRRVLGAAGMPEEMGELMASLIIRHSVMVQEELPAISNDSEGTCLLVGGAGRMGRWFTRFFNDLGWRVLIHDRVSPESDLPLVDDLATAANAADLVLITVPPVQTAEVLETLRGCTTVVADVASIKAPFADLATDLARSQPVASIHPMWGPDTRLLSGRNLLLLDCGNAQATTTVQAVFAPTAARVVPLALADHDRLMALALNLPHLLNLAFGHALAGQGVEPQTLGILGGPTFIKQARVCAEVSNESSEIYRQIQDLNPHGEDMALALQAGVAAVREAVGDPTAFAALMRDEAAVLKEFEAWWP